MAERRGCDDDGGWVPEPIDGGRIEPNLSGPDDDGLYWAQYGRDEPICLGSSQEEAERRLMAIEGVALDDEALLIE